MKYLIDVEYQAIKTDELTLHKGDIVTDVRAKDEGWMIGVLGGKEGLFPGNFGHELPEEEQDDENKNDDGAIKYTPSKKIQGAGYGNIFAKEEIKLRPVNKEKTEFRGLIKSEVISTGDHFPKKIAKVIENYNGKKLGELNLVLGDIVTVIDKENDGRWKGKLANGDIGLFSEKFVKFIDHDNINNDTETCTKALGRPLSAEPGQEPEVAKVQKVPPPVHKKPLIRKPSQKSEEQSKVMVLPAVVEHQSPPFDQIQHPVNIKAKEKEIDFNKINDDKKSGEVALSSALEQQHSPTSDQNQRQNHIKEKELYSDNNVNDVILAHHQPLVGPNVDRAKRPNKKLPTKFNCVVEEVVETKEVKIESTQAFNEMVESTPTNANQEKQSDKILLTNSEEIKISTTQTTNEDAELSSIKEDEFELLGLYSLVPDQFQEDKFDAYEMFSFLPDNQISKQASGKCFTEENVSPSCAIEKKLIDVDGEINLDQIVNNNDDDDDRGGCVEERTGENYVETRISRLEKENLDLKEEIQKLNGKLDNLNIRIDEIIKELSKEKT